MSVVLLAVVAMAYGNAASGDDPDSDLGLVLNFFTPQALVVDSDPPSTVATVPTGSGYYAGDCVISRGGDLGYTSNYSRDVWVVDMTTIPPSRASGINPIHLSNYAAELALTPDGRFLLACAIGSGGGISVIDASSRAEVSASAFADDCSSIDVCGDGSVLVTSIFTNEVRRLVLDAEGTLTDTGESLTVADPVNVHCAPDSRSGVVVSQGASILTSFQVPGLALASERSLGDDAVGLSGVFSVDGRSFYVRTLGMGVEAFGFDPATATLTSGPWLTLHAVTGNLIEGAETMALDPTGTKLFVPERSSIKVYDSRVGRLLGSIESSDLPDPTGICFRAAPDRDADGLTDELEAARGTNPDDPDTDGDGLLDGFEASAGLDPLVPGDANGDLDGDGLSNLEEQTAGTDASDADSDGDGLGDGAELSAGTGLLDPDTDDDDVSDGPDNCRTLYNPGQGDQVHPDGIGDECQDPDADEIVDATDNCPDDANPTQQDGDSDSLGDACDPCPGDVYNDPDGDGTCARTDNCPDASNPSQTDGDQDGLGDVCDTCPEIANPQQDEPAACIDFRPGETACLDALIDLTGEDVAGAITISRTFEEVPDELRFDALGFACVSTGALELELNGTAIGTLAIDPPVSCNCGAVTQSLVVSDRELIAAHWVIGGTNLFGVRKVEDTSALSWVRVTATKAHTVQRTCLIDRNGGDCTVPNACTAGYSFVPFDQAFPVRDRVAEALPVMEIPILHSVLPERIDLGELEDRGYELCVTAEAGSDCHAFAKQGEAFLAINGARCVPNTAPVAVIDGAGGPQECTSPAGRTVTLSGASSTDADSTGGTSDDIVLYEWFEDFGLPAQSPLGTGPALTSTFTLGSHAVTLRVTDRGELVDTASAAVLVVDTTPPTLSVSLSPSVLRPPYHRWVTVTADVRAHDACGVPAATLTSLTSSEPDTQGRDIRGAAIGTADFSFQLRAERDGRGPGRVYTVTYRADDGHGNVTDRASTVVVPHDPTGVAAKTVADR
jgi:hypothetical protein